MMIGSLLLLTPDFLIINFSERFMNKFFSNQANEVLAKHPEWLKVVEQACFLSSLPLGYCASAIEIFDQYGLLCGQRGELVYENQRNVNQPSEFIAWVLDGQLALFYVGAEIVVNRLNLMAASFATLSSLEGETGY